MPSSLIPLLTTQALTIFESIASQPQAHPALLVKRRIEPVEISPPPVVETRLSSRRRSPARTETPYRACRDVAPSGCRASHRACRDVERMYFPLVPRHRTEPVETPYQDHVSYLRSRLVSIRRESAAYSTNVVTIKQIVKCLSSLSRCSPPVVE